MVRRFQGLRQCFRRGLVEGCNELATLNRHDLGQDLACYEQKGDSYVVIAGQAISFTLVDVDNCCIAELNKGVDPFPT